jgi:hypothetical protein
MVNYYQNLNFDHIQKMIDSNDPTANDMLMDHTKITFVLMLQGVLRTIKLAVIILNLSYFIGILWFVFCEAERDFFNDQYMQTSIMEDYVTF